MGFCNYIPFYSLERYTADTAPCIQKDMIGEIYPPFTLPYGNNPCDYYGNPFNPDGTIQMYIHVSHSFSSYTRKDYKIDFKKPLSNDLQFKIDS